ncbi:hypothetical protein F5Y16DRAFT_382065 [Xylariaceae sp. FL0255]|nr:hypothetical protein F5Y16DRAFT_382065 [Xylariaceae sp. FL0255]
MIRLSPFPAGARIAAHASRHQLPRACLSTSSLPRSNSESSDGRVRKPKVRRPSQSLRSIRLGEEGFNRPGPLGRHYSARDVEQAHEDSFHGITPLPPLPDEPPTEPTSQPRGPRELGLGSISLFNRKNTDPTRPKRDEGDLRSGIWRIHRPGSAPNAPLRSGLELKAGYVNVSLFKKDISVPPPVPELEKKFRTPAETQRGGFNLYRPGSAPIRSETALRSGQLQLSLDDKDGSAAKSAEVIAQPLPPLLSSSILPKQKRSPTESKKGIVHLFDTQPAPERTPKELASGWLRIVEPTKRQLARESRAQKQRRQQEAAAVGQKVKTWKDQQEKRQRRQQPQPEKEVVPVDPLREAIAKCPRHLDLRIDGTWQSIKYHITAFFRDKNLRPPAEWEWENSQSVSSSLEELRGEKLDEWNNTMRRTNRGMSQNVRCLIMTRVFALLYNILLEAERRGVDVPPTLWEKLVVLQKWLGSQYTWGNWARNRESWLEIIEETDKIFQRAELLRRIGELSSVSEADGPETTIGPREEVAGEGEESTTTATTMPEETDSSPLAEKSNSATTLGTVSDQSADSSNLQLLTEREISPLDEIRSLFSQCEDLAIMDCLLIAAEQTQYVEFRIEEIESRSLEEGRTSSVESLNAKGKVEDEESARLAKAEEGEVVEGEVEKR